MPPQHQRSMHDAVHALQWKVDIPIQSAQLIRQARQQVLVVEVLCAVLVFAEQVSYGVLVLGAQT